MGQSELDSRSPKFFKFKFHIWVTTNQKGYARDQNYRATVYFHRLGPSTLNLIRFRQRFRRGYGHRFGHEFGHGLGQVKNFNFGRGSGHGHEISVNLGNGLGHGLRQSHDFGHGHGFGQGQVRKPGTRTLIRTNIRHVSAHLYVRTRLQNAPKYSYAW